MALSAGHPYDVCFFQQSKEGLESHAEHGPIALFELLPSIDGGIVVAIGIVVEEVGDLGCLLFVGEGAVVDS